MKKINKSVILCVIISCFSLASCTTNNNSSAEESYSSDSINDLPTPTPVNLDTKDFVDLSVNELVSTLKTLAENGIYNITYRKINGTYVDTLNISDGYYYTEYPAYGYGFFPKFPGRKDALFSFIYTYDEATVTDIERTVYTTTEGVTVSTQPTLQDLNIFNLFDGEDYGYLKEEKFVQDSSTSVSITDSFFALYMGVLLNYSETNSTTSSLVKTTFQKDRDGNIHFSLSVGEGYLLPNSRYYKGAISDIGTAKNEVIHNAMTNYAFPTQTITDSAKATLDSMKKEMDYTLYQTINYTDGKSETTFLADVRHRYDSSKAFYCSYSSSTTSDYEVYYRYVNPNTHALYTKAIDAKTGHVANNYVTTVGDFTYDTLVRYTPSGCLETNSFFGSDNVLNYYGGNLAMTLYFLTSCSLIYFAYSSYCTLTIELNDDGSIKDMIGTASGLSDSDGNEYTFSAIFTFKELSSDAFPEQTNKTDTAETLAFKEKFIDGKLDGTANVKIDMGSDEKGYKEEYIEADNILLIHSFGYDGNDIDGFTRNPSYDTYTGYKYDEDAKGLIPFELKKNDDGTFSVSSTGFLVEGTIKDNFAPFAFASCLIEDGAESNQYKINLAPLTNLDDALLFDELMEYGNDYEYTYMDYLNIETDGSYITSINYTVHYVFSTEESPAGYDNGYSYTYNVNQDENVLSALKGLKAKENPTTWEEESSELWSYLVSYLGEEEALNVPYVYRSEFAGHWRWMDASRYETEFTRIYIDDPSIENETFYDDLKAELDKNGSVWTRLDDEVDSAGITLTTWLVYQSQVGTKLKFSYESFGVVLDIFKAE